MKGKLRASEPDYVWALRDINLEIEQGEIVGIIGRNGAGKSTLLKLLSRVTSPTEGTIKSRGRIASLLEVGTGFHPELTGRENIYMNGAVLGMRRHEITRHLGEIIDFSGCEKYIDTPVKRYSSGMTVRLGFAVAAHLNCEILIVDEVLAVGDAEFQRKCIGKMRQVSSNSGRTVIFVSHNLTAIERLCKFGIVLKNGSVHAYTSTSNAISAYRTSENKRQFKDAALRTDRAGIGNTRIVFADASAPENKPITTGTALHLTIKYRKADGTPLIHPRFVVGIYDPNDFAILRFDSTAEKNFPRSLPACGTLTCISESLNITAGELYANIAIFEGGDLQDHLKNAISIVVEEGAILESPVRFSRKDCLVIMRHEWLFSHKE